MLLVLHPHANDPDSNVGSMFINVVYLAADVLRKTRASVDPEDNFTVLTLPGLLTPL